MDATQHSAPRTHTRTQMDARVQYAHPLCIVGHSEISGPARQVSSLYFATTPAVWNIWGAEHAELAPLDRPTLKRTLSSGARFVLRAAPRSTWVSAMEAGLSLFVREDGEYDCAYFLLLDDDIDFSLDEAAANAAMHADAQASMRAAVDGGSSPVESYLLYLLRKYQPALLAPFGPDGVSRAYPWSPRSPASPASEVAVATALDPAALCLHSSLLRYVLPFAPRGEGGFVGECTLPAIHLTFFLPQMYRSDALLAMHLHYVNKIHLGDKATSKSHLVALHNGSRHVYEYPQNDAYKTFLRAGLKSFDGDQRFGAEVNIDQLDWSLRSLDEYTNQDPSTAFRDFVPRLNRFYDLAHPAVTHRQWADGALSRDHSSEQRALISEPRLDFIVFTQNRVASLQRLIRSLLAADYTDAPLPINLRICVDWSPTQASVRSYLSSVHWPFGSLSVRYSPVPRSLRESILESWSPTSLDDLAVFLEDDVELSPLFMRWMRPAIKKYYYGANGAIRDVPIAGIALYAPIHSQYSDQPWQPRTNEAAYAHQLACSWGAAYTPGLWLSFLSWYARYSIFDPLLPGLVNINRWPMSFSWKKYFIRFMAETGAYMVYPRVGFNQSFSTNHVELGVNEQSLVSQARLRDQLTVGLVQQWSVPAGGLPDWSAMVKYDVWDREVSVAHASDRFPQPAWNAQEQFTLLLSASTRNLASLAASIDYWQALPLPSAVREIVVRWPVDADAADALLVCPKLSDEHLIQVPCRVENVGPSVLARLRPLVGVQTLLLLSVDSDVRLSADDTEFGFYTARLHPDQIVGFDGCAAEFMPPAQHAARKARLMRGAKLRTQPSVVLLRAAFFSPAHLESLFAESSSAWVLARGLVESEQSGEDLLLNLLIASAPANTKRWSYLIPSDVRNCSLSAAEARTQTAVGVRIAELFDPWPLESAKPFPAAWMKMWKNRMRVAPPTRVPSMAADTATTPQLWLPAPPVSALSSSSPPLSPLSAWSSLPLSSLVRHDGLVTVVLMSYQVNMRTAWLRRTISLFLSASFDDLIDRVILVWNNPSVPCPIRSAHSKFVLLEQPRNSLNARWTHTIPHIRTPAVLAMDDDLGISREALLCMLAWWRADPLRLVGAFVRRIRAGGTYVMDDLWRGEPYSIVLPRVILAGTSELERYARDEHRALRDYVDTQEAHCDDVLLNALSINATGRTPLRVQLPSSSLHDYFSACHREQPDAVGGLAMQSDRIGKRIECTRHIASLFPEFGNPLQKTSDTVAHCTNDGQTAGTTRGPSNTLRQQLSKPTCGTAANKRKIKPKP